MSREAPGAAAAASSSAANANTNASSSSQLSLLPRQLETLEVEIKETKTKLDKVEREIEAAESALNKCIPESKQWDYWCEKEKQLREKANEAAFPFFSASPLLSLPLSIDHLLVTRTPTPTCGASEGGAIVSCSFSAHLLLEASAPMLISLVQNY